MKFRPCIDIHNGQVKQIVGGSLKDQGDEAVTNFASSYDAAFYADLYKRDDKKDKRTSRACAKERIRRQYRGRRRYQP